MTGEDARALVRTFARTQEERERLEAIFAKLIDSQRYIRAAGLVYDTWRDILYHGKDWYFITQAQQRRAICALLRAHPRGAAVSEIGDALWPDAILACGPESNGIPVLMHQLRKEFPFLRINTINSQLGTENRRYRIGSEKCAASLDADSPGSTGAGSMQSPAETPPHAQGAIQAEPVRA